MNEVFLDDFTPGDSVRVPFPIRDSEDLRGILDLALVGVDDTDKLPEILHRMFPE